LALFLLFISIGLLVLAVVHVLRAFGLFYLYLLVGLGGFWMYIYYISFYGSFFWNYIKIVCAYMFLQATAVPLIIYTVCGHNRLLENKLDEVYLKPLLGFVLLIYTLAIYTKSEHIASVQFLSGFITIFALFLMMFALSLFIVVLAEHGVRVSLRYVLAPMLTDICSCLASLYSVADTELAILMFSLQAILIIPQKPNILSRDIKN